MSHSNLDFQFRYSLLAGNSCIEFVKMVACALDWLSHIQLGAFVTVSISIGELDVTRPGRTVMSLWMVANRLTAKTHPDGPLKNAQSVCLSVCFALLVCLPACLNACLSAHPSVCLSVRLSARLSVYLPICLCVYLPACLPVYLFVCMPVYLPLCLSTSLLTCLPACPVSLPL